MVLVQKYGGTSLAGGRLGAAARRVAAAAGAGHRVVVVVSARGDETDRLLELARQVSPQAPERELDALLATGEQRSAALMAMALENLGVPAISLTGAQAGVGTDRVYGNAQILSVHPEAIVRALDRGRVAVVAGFQGADPEGNITTLGRGGSDTTAVALAIALGAEKCQIFTDVDGVYDRDPRRFPDAKRFSRLGYDEMLALIENGAQVLHDRGVHLARKHHLPIQVLSAFDDGEGTVVS